MTARPPGLRRTPPPLRRLFGPLLPLPEGVIWSVGWFRCVACPGTGATELAQAAASPLPPGANDLTEKGPMS